MNSYYNATIFKNGHPLSYTNEIANSFCSKCGAESISRCPNCQANIRGKIKSSFVSIGDIYKAPLYCFNCGKPFPWTVQEIESVKELIDDDDQLDKTSKEKLTDVLPDIITETPKSKLASNRVKKAFIAAGKFTAEGLRQFVIEFGCELVKQQLGL